jgi:hypothetical protein
MTSRPTLARKSQNRNSKNAVRRAAARPVMFEPVEQRQMMSVTLNPAGWSVVTPSASARVVYVSSAHGSDKNSGLSSATPVRSLAAATALMRTGHDDEMLLERGNTWTTSFPTWTKSGVSAQEPMLIGTYGTGNRPVIATGTSSGFVANTKNAVNYLMIDGIVFDASARDSSRGAVSAAAAAADPTGIQILGPSNGLVIEDSSFEYYKDNMVFQAVMGPVTNVTIRRSTVEDSYAVNSKSQGLYADGVAGLTIDQDVFDHNGWNASVSGAGQTGYNHDIYTYSTVSGLSVTNSVIARASYMGIMARAGGIIDNNLFLDDAYAVSFGDADGATSKAGGVSGEMDNNVVMSDHGLPGSQAGGGFEIGNTAASAHVTVSGNIFTGDTQNNYAAISLSYANTTSNPGVCVGLNNVTISNNIFDGWHSGISLANFTDGGSGLSSLNGLVVTGNQFQDTFYDLVSHGNAYNSEDETWSNNTYFATSSAASSWFVMTGTDETGATWAQTVDKTGTDKQLTYVNPAATVETLNASLGGAATEAAFMAALDSRSDSNWAAGLTTSSVLAYVKAGFTVKSGAIQPAPVTPVTAVTKLTGTTIGTAGSYQNDGNTIAKATDGNLSSFFDGATANGNWVGLNLGSAKSVSQISFAPRAGFASRMVGGYFQVSTSANFTTGVTTVYTITTAPVTGSLTTIKLSSPATGQYVRYVSPAGSYGNVAEIVFYG